MSFCAAPCVGQQDLEAYRARTTSPSASSQQSHTKPLAVAQSSESRPRSPRGDLGRLSLDWATANGFVWDCWDEADGDVVRARYASKSC